MVNIIVNSDECKGCGACVKACLKDLLYIDNSTLNKHGYNPVKITRAYRCVACGACALVCPEHVFEILGR